MLPISLEMYYGMIDNIKDSCKIKKSHDGCSTTIPIHWISSAAMINAIFKT